MPDPIKSGSKVKSLEKKIQSIRTKKKDLKEGIRDMSKQGHRGDVGLVKEMEGMDAQIAKLRSQLKELKGSGGGAVKGSGVTKRKQDYLNKEARNKNL